MAGLENFLMRHEGDVHRDALRSARVEDDMVMMLALGSIGPRTKL